MTVKGLYDRVKRLDVSEVSRDTMEEAAPLLTDRQKDQLLEGKNREGKTIGRYRNPAYARFKNSMNPVPGLGVPDLRLTGDFYKQIFTDIRGDVVIIDSVDPKTIDLVKKYGEEIFGLNKTTKKEFIKDLQPIFMKQIKKVTGL